MHSNKLPGKPDIMFKGRKLAIFINGCFWHQHKGCKRSTIPKTNQEYWLPKLKRNVLKQRDSLKELKEAGWRTLIIWECQSKREDYLQKIFKK